VRRKKASALRPAWRWTAIVAGVLAFAMVVIGLVYAGSPHRLAAGVKIAGVDVGGLSDEEALSRLENRAQALEHVPVVFTAGDRRWPISPHRLGIRVDWAAAVRAAQGRGSGFGPFRGLKRLKVRFFGVEISPSVHVWSPALNYQVGLIAKDVDQRHRDAAVRRNGLRIHVVPGQTGRVLDRAAAPPLIVHALASLRRHPVGLPIRQDQPRITPADLAPAARDARRALRASVQLRLGPTRWRVPRREIATLLELPSHGARTLAIGGPDADRFFKRLAKQVNRAPQDADWAVSSKGVRVTPTRDGLAMERVKTEKALMAALVSGRKRVATVAVATTAPRRSVAEASSMGIIGLVGSYTTIYGGDPNRIHNVQLVAHLIDHTLIGPGATFSFNQTTGDRNASKGFLEAPVIINGELGTGLGGGVCQVSTTTFNAAYDAGLDITDRTNHALYISHYPQGRDATVNYPDTDLKFVNDTPHWLLLRTFVGSYSLTVNLYGTPVHRRVVTDTAPLKVTGPVPVKKIPDGNLLKGHEVVQESGSAPLSTSVHRTVYSPSGKLLHDDVWYSSYRGETRVVRVGTKKPPPKPKPKTTTTPTSTTPTTTTGPTSTQP
jgi:vancomycin resistance protein YoaR